MQYGSKHKLEDRLDINNEQSLFNKRELQVVFDKQQPNERKIGFE